MPIDTDLNISPYYDDYDETKDYHKVLFRPAVPLQAREITQLQTILQTQIERFGGYQFKEGTIIKGCSFSFDSSIKYAKILDKTQSSTPVDVNVALFAKNDYLRSPSTNLVAQVVDTRSGLETQNPDMNTLFFHYINTGVDGANSVSKFSAGEVLEIYPSAAPIAADHNQTDGGDVIITVAGNGYSNSDTVVISSALNGVGAAANVVTNAGTDTIKKILVTANGTGYTIQDYPTISVTRANTQLNATSLDFVGRVQLQKTANVTIAGTTFENAANAQFNVLGSSYQMKVSDGVVYQKGNFQRFEEQDIIVSPYTNRPHDVVVGVVTTESVVNSSIDTSLLDNASGYTNENAPGADRLKLTPVLTVNTLAAVEASNNYLSLVKFQNGQRIAQNQKPVLADMSDEFARRTYEESGDYVVDPFIVSTEGIAGSTGANNLSVVVGRGKGYVRGYRFETVGTTRVTVKKATTFTNAASQSVSVNFGHHINVNELKGEFGVDNNDQILILDNNLNALSNNNIAIPAQSSETVTMGNVANVIGTARVRGLELSDENVGRQTTQYRAYIYDIKMNAGKSFKKHAKGIHHYASTEHSAGNTNTAFRGNADIVLDGNPAVAQIKDADFNKMVFPVGQLGVKSVGSATFIKRKDNELTVAQSNGSTSWAVTGSEQFNFGTDDGVLNEVQERQVIVTARESRDGPQLSSGGKAAANPGLDILANTATSTLRAGDYVKAGSSIRQIVSVVNSTTLKLNAPISANAGTLPVSRTFPLGSVIGLGDRSASNLALSNNGKTLTVNLGTALSGGTMLVNIAADIKDTSENGLKKTVATSYVKIDTSSNAGGATGPWCLGIPDALSLTAVYWNESAYSEASGDDKTAQFELDNGQKDGYYGLSKLKKKAGSSLSIDNNDFIVVKVKHFVKSVSAGTGFYSYQSYHDIVDDVNPTASQITTQQIPVFASPTNGKEFSLRDCIDFRPNMAATATISATLSGASVNPSSVETMDSNNDVASPNKSWVSTVEYYLPRKDRLVVEKAGFAIIEGVPSVNPTLPEKPDDSMQLATIDVPIYPSLDAKTARVDGRPDLGVRVKPTQLKRYSMKDIKVIDERVQNLEYYSSLNMLEKQSTDETLPGRTDPTLPRFKNGFLVDNFSSVTTGNPLNAEFKAGYDKSRNLLTSRFETYSLQLKMETGSRVSRSGDLVTMKYQQGRIISQPNATQTRRCTSMFWEYNGVLSLFPDYISDVDHTIVPESAVQIDVDVASPTLALIAELNKIAPNQLSSERVVSEDITTSLSGSTTSDTTRTDTMETVITQQIERTTSSLSSRSTTTTKSVGDFVTDISFQPYIPATTIDFVAEGLRPNLRHYVYFDDVAVSEHVMPTGLTRSRRLVGSHNRKSSFVSFGGYGAALVSDARGRVTGKFRVPQGVFFAGERKFVVADISNLSQIDTVVSKAIGKFNCYNFSMESGEVSVSTRSTVPSSTSSSQIINSQETTRSEVITTLPPPVIIIEEVEVPVVVVEANTVIDNPDEGRAETNPPVVVANTVTIPANTSPVIPAPEPPTPTIPARPPVIRPCWDRVQGREWARQMGNRGNRRWRNGCEDVGERGPDPLAQTFMIEPSALPSNSESAYLTSINLYFSERDPIQGVTVEIRETDNGSPAATVLPFSRVHLEPGEVTTSTNGRGVTNVAFTSPVFVEADKEYCVVILPDGNSPNYSVFTAKAGQNELNNSSRQINQDWGKGTMFLSTNNRTWTEFLDEDMKFEVLVAVFESKVGQVKLVNEDYEWLKASAAGVTNFFRGGQEVYKDVANATGTVSFAVGSSVVTGSGTSFTTSVVAGDSIVLKSNAFADVVTVKSVSSDTRMVLENRPAFSGSGNNYVTTLTGTFVSLDEPTGTVLINDSTSKSGSVFADGDSIVGAVATVAEGAAPSFVIGTDGVVDTSISYFEPQLYRNTPSGTTVVPRIEAKRSGFYANGSINDSLGVSDSERFRFNDRNYPAEKIKVMSKSNEITNNAGNKSLTVLQTMSADRVALSPSIDLQSQSLVVYENIINNDVTNEYLGITGSADAKYISRTVTLAEGLDAEDIKVFVNAWKPAGTDVKVYAKVLNQADTTSFADSHWSELQAVKNNSKSSSSVDRRDVVEYSYEFADTPEVTEQVGTIATNETDTITGTNTQFNTDYDVGDLIKIVNLDNNIDYIVTKITTITNDTSIVCADVIPFTKIDGAKHYKVNTSHLSQVFRDPKAPVAYQATYYNGAGEKFVGYKQLAIKIVMTSDSTNISPYLRDYRAIAVSL
jgi:hypothetical protein